MRWQKRVLFGHHPITNFICRKNGRYQQQKIFYYHLNKNLMELHLHSSTLGGFVIFLAITTCTNHQSVDENPSNWVLFRFPKLVIFMFHAKYQLCSLIMSLYIRPLIFSMAFFSVHATIYPVFKVTCA
jgi:hypothetical protein